jgi:hypothetical protein
MLEPPMIVGADERVVIIFWNSTMRTKNSPSVGWQENQEGGI